MINLTLNECEEKATGRTLRYEALYVVIDGEQVRFYGREDFLRQFNTDPEQFGG